LIPLMLGMMLAMAAAVIVFITVAYAMEFDANEKLASLPAEPSRQVWATPIDSIPNLPQRQTPTDLIAAYTHKGNHRAVTRPKAAKAVAVGTAVALVLVASPASATVPKPGEGLIALTARVCGSSSTWKDVAKANGVTGPNYVIYRGRDYKVVCNRPTKATRGNDRTTGWQLPLSNYRLTSCYRTASRPSHAGIDMAAAYGTPIRAVHGGTVRSAGWRFGGYGISVVVEHGANVYSHYAHMSRDAVSVGQRVGVGQVIGYVGSTGDSTGNHLHLEVWRGWFNQISPAPYLRAHGVGIGC